MRILLIRPPYRYVPGSVAGEIELPIGVIQLAACLEAAGHTVRVYDAAVRYDLDRMNAEDDSGCGEVHIGDTWEAFRREIAAEPWDLVGVSNQFYTQMPYALEAARVVRETLPEALVVIGGPPATVRPDDYLAEPAVDAVLRGEADETLVRLAGALESGRDYADIDGLSLRHPDGSHRHNPPASPPRDLDALPLPAYHRLNLEEHYHAVRRDDEKGWRFEARRVIPIVTSRGCPFNCSFCSIHLHMGRRWRANSVEYVLDHVRHIVTELGVRTVFFMDDNFGLDARRLEAILDGLIAMKAEGLGIEWRTPTGMRVDRLTRAILAKAREAGCVAISLAVESGSQRVLDEVIHKKLDLDKVLEVAGWCREVGIKARAGYIMGMPGETLDDMLETVRFALRLKKRYRIRGHLATATPFYGTELHAICEREGYLIKPMTPENVARGVQGESMIETPEFTPGDLIRIRQKFESQGGWLRRTLREMDRRRRHLLKRQVE